MKRFIMWMILSWAGLHASGGWASAQNALTGDVPFLQSLSPRPKDDTNQDNPIFDQRTTPVDSGNSEGSESGAGVERRERGRKDELETDRDSFTPATTVVGVGKTVIESAWSYEDHRGLKPTNSVPELIIRHGLSDRVEFRVGWNYDVGGAGNDTSGADSSDPDPTRAKSSLIREYTLLYGLKVQLTEHDGWMPGTIVIVQGFTPTGGSPGTSAATQMIATYAAGWELPNKWRFDTSIRYGTASESGDHFSQWAPSAVLRVPLGEKWAVHCEYFAIITSGKSDDTTQQFISPGLHYLVNENLEVGFRLGWGVNDQTDRFFSNIGFGWRF